MDTEVVLDVLCRNRKPCRPPKKHRLLGVVLIGTGLGLFLAFILPQQFLVIILGIALICFGVCNFKDN